MAGEILKSLWSGLNTITPVAQTATLAHWAEIIDEHVADSNHKKTLAIECGCGFWHLLAAVLCERYIQAKVMLQEATDCYNKISSIVSETLLNTWNKAITSAESHRMSNLSVMDILGSKVVDTNRYNGTDCIVCNRILYSVMHYILYECKHNSCDFEISSWESVNSTSIATKNKFPFH